MMNSTKNQGIWLFLAAVLIAGVIAVIVKDKGDYDE